MTSKPLVRRTLATLRSAELGFLGVVVYTRVQTPRRNGVDLSVWGVGAARVQTPRRDGFVWSAGDLSLPTGDLRPWRISWLIVGIRCGLGAFLGACLVSGRFCHRLLSYQHLRPRSRRGGSGLGV